MSLRYMSRVLYQSGMRAMQGMKDQAFKCDSKIKSIGDSASPTQARRLSGALDSSSTACKAANSDKLKRAEESLRTVMYLSCWGPN